MLSCGPVYYIVGICFAILRIAVVSLQGKMVPPDTSSGAAEKLEALVLSILAPILIHAPKYAG